MDVYDLLIDCIVHIQTDTSLGTGLAPGLIFDMCSCHSEASQITVTRKDTRYSASLIFSSAEPYPDLVVLEDPI